MSYLPSKKVRVVALIVLIILIGFFWHVGKQNTKNQVVGSDLIYTNPEVLAQKQKERELADFIETKIAEEGGLENASSTDFVITETYTEKSLHLTNDNSAASLKKYGLTIAQILTPLSTAKTNGGQITIEALENRDTAKVAQLETEVKIFAQMTAALASTTVPSSATTVHLETLNHLAYLTNLLEDMSLVLEEPIVALEAARSYTVNFAELYNTLGHVNSFFASKNIIFSETERTPVSLVKTN